MDENWGYPYFRKPPYDFQQKKKRGVSQCFYGMIIGFHHEKSEISPWKTQEFSPPFYSAFQKSLDRSIILLAWERDSPMGYHSPNLLAIPHNPGTHHQPTGVLLWIWIPRARNHRGQVGCADAVPPGSTWDSVPGKISHPPVIRNTPLNETMVFRGEFAAFHWDQKNFGVFNNGEMGFNQHWTEAANFEVKKRGQLRGKFVQTLEDDHFGNGWNPCLEIVQSLESTLALTA